MLYYLILIISAKILQEEKEAKIINKALRINQLTDFCTSDFFFYVIRQ